MDVSQEQFKQEQPGLHARITQITNNYEHSFPTNTSKPKEQPKINNRPPIVGNYSQRTNGIPTLIQQSIHEGQQNQHSNGQYINEGTVPSMMLQRNAMAGQIPTKIYPQNTHLNSKTKYTHLRKRQNTCEKRLR
jgi:hypothetical protein